MTDISKERLEDLAGNDCREYDKHLNPKPCGECQSCLARELERLRALLAEREKDAARYRWLAISVEKLPYPDTWGDKTWLDDRIDAAIAAQERA